MLLYSADPKCTCNLERKEDDRTPLMPKGKFVFQITAVPNRSFLHHQKDSEGMGRCLRHGEGENQLPLLHGLPLILPVMINSAQLRVFYLQVTDTHEPKELSPKPTFPSLVSLVNQL